MRKGRFTILRPLSKGGMGALYLATETIATGKRNVVLKEMLDYYDPADPQGQSKAQKRFEAEAVTLANLSVPGIPQVFDYFTEGGRYFIVMQFIEGQNLESGLTHIDDAGKTINGKAYSVEQVRRWGIELCKMLEGLSAQNVIHMDIKPANLILDRSGRVWLVDFGTARASLAAMPGPNTSQPALKKSSVYGTMGYAAPEQAAGRPEARSDVYALAATLYHLACDDDPGTHPAQFPRLSRLPVDFSSALKRALSVDVRQRITAAEFGRLLEPRTTRSLGFHWQNGVVSTDPIEIAAEASRSWDEARLYYAGDAWDKWLEDLHRHDLVVKLAQTRRQYPDSDLGLDAFLRIINPNLPVPSLHLPATLIDMGIVPWRSQLTVNLEIQNQGGGCLQARLLNISPGVQLSPQVVVVPNRQVAKLTLDTTSLTPTQAAQMVPVIIDAGLAGKVKIQIKVQVPEPDLVVDPHEINLGSVYRGQRSSDTFTVANPGSSPFLGEAVSQDPAIGLHPANFEIISGGSRIVMMELETSKQKIGQHTVQILVNARAAGWEHSQPVKVYWEVSGIRTFWKFWMPPIAWMAGGGVIAGTLGWFFVVLAAEGYFVADVLIGFLAGAVLGMLICVLPAMIMGALGALGKLTGRAGLRRGSQIGAVIGGFLGGLVGALAAWYGVTAGNFGALVGIAVGLAMGYIGYHVNH